MNPDAEFVVSIALSIAVILGTLGFVLFCILVVCHGVWVFGRTIWPHVRHRHVARGFDVLPARVSPLTGAAAAGATRSPTRLAPIHAGQK